MDTFKRRYLNWTVTLTVSPCRCLYIKICPRYHLYCYSTTNVITLVGFPSLKDQFNCKNCFSVERLITSNTDLHSIMQSINKFAAGQARTIFANTIQISLHWHILGRNIFYTSTLWIVLTNSDVKLKIYFFSFLLSLVNIINFVLKISILFT